jgi:hypothetical protein
MGPWATSRVLVLLSVAFAHRIADTAGPLRAAVPQHIHRGLLGWDAERYRQIAEQGYAALPRIELRFFPLVPMVTRAIDAVLPGGAGVALLVQANGAALLLGWLVLRLVVHEKGDAELGRTAVWLVYLTPAAFVLAWGYSEALWGCLSVGFLLALRQRRWWVAAAIGVLAGLARPVAPLLVLPALIEAGAGVRPVAREWVGRAAAVASPVIGAGLYLAWVWQRFGDAFYPYRIQQNPHFRGAAADPITPILHTARAAWHGDEFAALRVAWAIVLLVLVVVAFQHWPPSFGVFAGATLLVALSTERLGSFERYGFSAVPVVLALAGLVHRRPRALLAANALGAAALVGYGTLALLGSYTP